MKKMFRNKEKDKEQIMSTSTSSNNHFSSSISSTVHTFQSMSVSSTSTKSYSETYKLKSSSKSAVNLSLHTSNNEAQSNGNKLQTSGFTRYSDANPYQTFGEFKNLAPRSAFISQPLTTTSNQNSSPKLSNIKSIFTSQPSSITTSNRSFSPKLSSPKSTLTSPQSISNQSLLTKLASVKDTTPKIKEKPQQTQTAQVQEILQLKINVKKSTRWYDDPSSIVPCYRTRSVNRAKVLLINIRHFSLASKERKGSEKDEKHLKELFKQMGFEVISPVKSKWKKEDLEKAIKDFKSSSNLKKFDISIVIVMSHGSGSERSDSTVISCSDNTLVETNWIVSQFDGENCKQLLAKPKIFIFQCCRGANHYAQKMPQVDGILNNAPVSTKGDVLIAYATVPGFVSYRYEHLGSWYIYTLCKVFMDHAHNTHVEDLLKIVDSRLAEFSVGIDLDKQTSSFENRGFKHCFLHPKYYG